MKSLSRLLAVTRKEVRQMRRDRLTFAMIFGIPLMQIILFGYAINTDVRNLRTAIADEANTHLSRDFIARLDATQVTDVHERVDTVAQLEERLRSGAISVGIAIPPDFDRRVADDTRAAAHILVDGSDPTIAGIADQFNLNLGMVRVIAVVSLMLFFWLTAAVYLSMMLLVREKPLRYSGTHNEYDVWRPHRRDEGRHP